MNSRKRQIEDDAAFAAKLAASETAEIVVSEEQYAFCCSYCRCSDKDIGVYWDRKFNCGNSGNGRLWHRGCCHRFLRADCDSLSPMQIAIQKGINSLGKSEKPIQIKVSDLQRKFMTAKRNETLFLNQQFDAAPDSRVYSDTVYSNHVRKFHARVKNPKLHLEKLTVLDLFSGIGSGTVVLKKLGIPLKTIVHVDHDPVADYVNKFNHKKSAIGIQVMEPDDGVEHFYFEKYEYVNENIQELIQQYGPFDLLLAGPPCQNFSLVNAFRVKDVSSDYLSDVGNLISKIDEIQKTNNPSQSDLLFVVENVTFESDKEIEVSKRFRNLVPIKFEAADFGPCKRYRLYYTNIAVRSGEEIIQVAKEQSACPLLEDNFKMAETICKKKGIVIIPKTNTFMASKARIDDDRMMKVRKVGKKYEVGTYSVCERERMLGLPVGYVGKAVKALFNDLRDNAFKVPETSLGAHWRTTLRSQLHHFRKKSKFRMKKHKLHPFFQIMISSPIENFNEEPPFENENGKKPIFFDEEEYCKHLLGNGWSIPVVQHILEPLKEIILDGKAIVYEGFQYNFPWAPYNCL